MDPSPAAEAPDAPDASVASLPDARPIDSSATASSSSHSKKVNPSVPFSAIIKATPSAVDAFLARLHRCLQTRADADVVLFFLCYLSRLSGAVLEDLSRSALRQSAQRLIALATKLPPATTVTLSGPLVSSPGAVLAAVAMRLSVRLKAFSGLLSEIRTFGRLWGLLGLYFAVRGLVMSRLAPKSEKDAQAQPKKSSFDTAVSVAQLTALVSFQATENVAYLASKKVLPVQGATLGKVARWSVRSWACYVFMEVGRHLVERRRKVVAAAKNGKTVAAEDAEWDAAWKRDFFRNLAWAPLTIHWSVANGPLSELVISLLAMYPAYGQMKDLWRSKA